MLATANTDSAKDDWNIISINQSIRLFAKKRQGWFESLSKTLTKSWLGCAVFQPIRRHPHTTKVIPIIPHKGQEPRKDPPERDPELEAESCGPFELASVQDRLEQTEQTFVSVARPKSTLSWQDCPLVRADVAGRHKASWTCCKANKCKDNLETSRQKGRLRVLAQEGGRRQ
jgi:hypothetical protein